MTDQQRGAYTPQQEVPLQFDPRSTAARRPLPMALIASATLLVVLMAAVAMYFSHGVRGENEPPRPVGAPMASLKAAPAAGAQPADTATAGPDVSATANKSTKPPSFAAAPEQPLPRAPANADHLTVQTLPAPPAVVPAPAPTSAPVRVAAAPQPAQAAPAPAAEPSLGHVATKAAALTQAAPEPAAKAAMAWVAPKPPQTSAGRAVSLATEAAPASTGAAGPARVQIGAFSSAALAAKGFNDVGALIPGALSGRGKDVEPVEVGGHTLYRAAVAGFPTRAAATAFCEALKAKGKICFVKS